MKNTEGMECVRCGARAMVEGTVTETSSGGDVTFSPSQASYLKRMFSIGSRKVKAFACLHCSHLELMVDFTDRDRKKYQDFEGPQPPVLDRIGEGK